MEAEQEFIQRFDTWARAQPDILTAFVVGSFGSRTALPGSDVDLAFVTRRPQRYTKPYQWLDSLGTVWAAIYDAQDSLMGLPTSASLFCSLEDGLTVDFSILPYGKTWLWFQLMRRTRFLAHQNAETAYLFQQGVIILFDKTGFLGRLQKVAKAQSTPLGAPPSKQAVEMLQEDFYLGILKMVRYILKGELFAAQTLRERVIRRCLITMAQWEAQTQANDWQNPLKYRDRKIEHWADPVLVTSLPTLFNGYDGDALWQSIHTSLRVFAELSSRSGYEPDQRARNIQKWVNQSSSRLMT